MSRHLRIVLAPLAALLGAGSVVGQPCQPVWSGVDGGADWQVRALAVFDEDGAGPTPPGLYAAGGFSTMAGLLSPSIARWDGWAVSGVAGLTSSVYGSGGANSALALPAPEGNVPAGLYVGGDFEQAGETPANNIARRFSFAWHDVGGGVTRPGRLYSFVFAIAAFDGELYVGGQFDDAGGTPAPGLARWDGERWSAVGGGLGTLVAGTDPKVKAMAIYDDGRGPALYVAGSFEIAGGKECWNIARWDGAEWEPVGPGINSAVFTLCIYDEDGAGPGRPALFAGGEFNRVRGGERYTLTRIGRWDGAEWTAVGGWYTSGSTKALAVWDPDGAGPAKESLYMGGLFTETLPGGEVASKIARWDGQQWHALGAGLTGYGTGTSVHAIAPFDEDGPGPNPGGLYVGGLFGYAGGVLSKHIARWGCPLGPRPCAADCDGDTELTFFDFLCFQNQFAFGDMRADCDGDGSLTFFDFLCFQNQFSAGCP
ncbi:MAG: GC-type dockerin domain-anchored protein [Phycisphaerales bacterium JB039]